MATCYTKYLIKNRYNGPLLNLNSPVTQETSVPIKVFSNKKFL